MEDKEKRVVQNIAWWLSIGIGLLVAERVYNFSTTSYIRTFHPEEYNKAIKESEEEA